MENWDLRVAVRDKLWPLDPGCCRRCGWPIGKRKGCTADLCEALLPYDTYRYDNPPDIESYLVFEYALEWLRKRHYRYMTIWTGAQYVFQVWDTKSILINKHHVNLGIAIAEAILELP